MHNLSLRFSKHFPARTASRLVLKTRVGEQAMLFLILNSGSSGCAKIGFNTDSLSFLAVIYAKFSLQMDIPLQLTGTKLKFIQHCSYEIIYFMCTDYTVSISF